MRHISQLRIFAAFGAVLSLSSCSKEDSIAPKTELAQQKLNDGTIISLRNSQLYFPGAGSTGYLGAPIDLCGLSSVTGTNGGVVLMDRKNFITAANGGKIMQTWESVVPLNPSQYTKPDGTPVTFPYTWTGIFTDQDALTSGYLFNVTFSIDRDGNAKASLQWNGQRNSAYPLPVNSF